MTWPEGPRAVSFPMKEESIEETADNESTGRTATFQTAGEEFTSDVNRPSIDKKEYEQRKSDANEEEDSIQAPPEQQ